jgi:hypothetical protein
MLHNIRNSRHEQVVSAFADPIFDVWCVGWSLTIAARIGLRMHHHQTILPSCATREWEGSKGAGQRALHEGHVMNLNFIMMYHRHLALEGCDWLGRWDR